MNTEPCFHCEKPVRTDRPYWAVHLETSGYVLDAEEEVPYERDQGWFAVGPECRSRYVGKAVRLDALVQDGSGDAGVVHEVPVILDEVRDAVIRHIRRVRPGREVVGILVVRNGVAIRYQRLHNTAKSDRFNTFRLRGKGNLPAQIKNRKPGDWAILIHNHPSGDNSPSEGDLSGASIHWLGVPYAIVGNRSNDYSIRFWELNGDRKTFRELFHGSKRKGPVRKP